MTDLFTLFATSFSQESFKEGIIRSFTDTGTQPPSPPSTPLLVGPLPRPAFKEYKAEDCSGTIRIPTEHSAVQAAINEVLDGDDSDADDDGNESDNDPGNSTFAGSEDDEYEVDDSDS